MVSRNSFTYVLSNLQREPITKNYCIRHSLFKDSWNSKWGSDDFYIAQGELYSTLPPANGWSLDTCYRGITQSSLQILHSRSAKTDPEVDQLQNIESEDDADNFQRQSSVPETTYCGNSLESQSIVSRHATIEDLPLLEEEIAEVFESSYASSTSNSPSPGKQFPTWNRVEHEENSISGRDEVSQTARNSQKSFTSALASLGRSRSTQKRRDPPSTSSSNIESSFMSTSTSGLRKSSSASLGSTQSTSQRRRRRRASNY